jgi:hypothetical protein
MVGVALSLSPTVGRGQEARGPWTIGADLTTLHTGTPEFWVGRDLGRSFRLVGAGGYTYKAIRTGCQVDDGIDPYDLEGGYARMGVEARSPVSDGGQVFVRVSYVASWFDETGIRSEWSPVTGERETSFERTHGFANGVALATGWDFALHRGLCVQVGLQLGRSDRQDYIGAPCRSLQPGLGFGGGMPARFILSFSYSFGRRGPAEQDQQAFRPSVG